jgi:hypothetical protein
MLFELAIFLKAHFTKQAAEAIGMIICPGYNGQDALAGADARAPGGRNTGTSNQFSSYFPGYWSLRCRKIVGRPRIFETDNRTRKTSVASLNPN